MQPRRPWRRRPPHCSAWLVSLLLGLAAGRAEAASASSAASRLAGKLRASAESLGRGFVEAMHFEHKLRVCNAYPYVSTVSVRHGQEDLSGDEPLSYKSCRDFETRFNLGDRLDFFVGDTGAGTFEITDVPGMDAVLLLIITRHDTVSTAVAFQSHVFANVLNAQLAVIDAYKGHEQSTPRISSKHSTESEELRFNSVVAVNQGIYKVDLLGDDGYSKTAAEFVALNRESYVLLRVGVEAQQGPDYKQEFVIFPRSNVLALMGRAGPRAGGPCAALVLAVAAALMSAWL